MKVKFDAHYLIYFMIRAFFVLMVMWSSVHLYGTDVTLLFPDDGEELTDIAVSFKAKITSDGPYYLYVSKNADFSGEVIQRPAQTGKGKIVYNTQYFLTYQGKVTPDDKFLLTPGTWYWKVSGDGGITFSETRSLIVNNDRTLTPPEWDIGPDKPLFHMRLRSQVVDNAPGGDIGAALKKIIPDDLKEYIVLDIGHSFSFLPKERSLYEYSKIFDDLGYKYFYDMGSHAWLGRIASLGEMEKVFRDLNHCVGASTPEIFYYIYNSEADRSMMDGALELCRKYGKKFLMADMNWKWAKWQYFNYLYYDIFEDRNYADYYIPQFKTTDPWGAYTNISSIQGMKLTGMVKDIGIWADWWCWEKFGQVNTIELEDFLDGGHSTGNEKVYPYMQYIKQYIYGISFGSTTFALEANLQWHWLTAEPNDHYYRYLEPFVRAVVEEKIIPSEEAIEDNFSIIVDTEFSSGDLGQTAPLTYVEGNIWGDFLRSTYGISDIEPYNSTATSGGEQILQCAYLEMIPNTDRYPSGIPFLPKPGIEVPEVNGKQLEVISISDLDTKSKVNSVLNPYYPESHNEAYARRIDSSIFVFNTIENHDISQSYAMAINYAGIDSLWGDVALMSYVVGRCRPDSQTIFFQTNAYVRNPASEDINGGRYLLPAYPSVLHFKCQSQPVVASNESGAIVKNQWNVETKTLTLEIDHTTAGAVNFTLTGLPGVSYDADSIELTHYHVEVGVSEQIQLTGNIYPDTLKGISLTWRSLNPNIARVTANGLLTGIYKGTVDIVAQMNDLTDTISCEVFNIPVTSVDILEDTIILYVDETDTVPVSVLPRNATIASLTWTSSNTSIATVTPAGILTGKAPGETYVISLNEDSGLFDSCYVRIEERLVERIDLGKDTIYLHVDENIKFIPTIIPENAHNKDILWEIEREGIVTSDNSGKIHAVDSGMLYVYAVNETSGVKDSCLVVVTHIFATSVTLNASSKELILNEDFKFLASIEPSNTTNKSIEWESGNDKIVTISQYGWATALSPGETFIAGHNRASDLSDTCVVTVIDATGMDLSFEERLYIYPNPVSQGTPIQIQVRNNSMVSLLNASGQVVYTSNEESGNFWISTEDLKAGVYLLLVRSTSDFKIEKLVVLNQIN